MYRHHTNNIQKAFAVFLVLLLASVTGVKALHTHHYEKAACSGVVISATPAHCDICEFQLAKDGELPPRVCVNLQVAYHVTPVISPEIVFFSTTKIILAERGPPVA